MAIAMPASSGSQADAHCAQVPAILHLAFKGFCCAHGPGKVLRIVTAAEYLPCQLAGNKKHQYSEYRFEDAHIG
jgi:hypothetical protein